MGTVSALFFFSSRRGLFGIVTSAADTQVAGNAATHATKIRGFTQGWCQEGSMFAVVLAAQLENFGVGLFGNEFLTSSIVLAIQAWRISIW